jgi:carboxylate-amine ligase
MDDGMIYFDVRPSARYPTLEIRLCDAVSRVDDVLLITALARALVRRCTAEVQAGEPIILPPRQVLEAARWRAARSGLCGDLLHPLTGRPVPAAEAVAALLTHVAGGLAAEGELERVQALALSALETGGSAGRQRAAMAEGGLEAVVDLLLAETAADSRSRVPA